eukprot:8355555-Heterocapsa_arctica.AAC.1
MVVLRGRLLKLKAKKPLRLGAKQLFLKDLMRIAADWDRTGKMKAPAGVQKTIMKKHSESFQNMPME